MEKLGAMSWLAHTKFQEIAFGERPQFWKFVSFVLASEATVRKDSLICQIKRYGLVSDNIIFQEFKTFQVFRVSQLQLNTGTSMLNIDKAKRNKPPMMKLKFYM